MNYQVLKGLLLIYYFLAFTNAIGIDGKLDFGTARVSPASFKSYGSDQRNTFIPGIQSNIAKTANTNDDFDNIGVVCVSGGCNITESTNSTENTIQTDVLVHIHTKVDLNQVKKTAEEIPDVPVVIGRGSKLDTTIDEGDSPSVYPQSQFELDVDPLSEIPTYNQAYPSTSTSFDSQINTHSSPSIISSISPSISSRVDSNSGGSADGFYPSIKTNTFYSTQRDPKIHINTEPRSSVAIITTDGDKLGKANGIEITIPFFASAYQNHYRGESPPPQYVWYTKKSNSINPVEFKTVKSTWTPSVWNRNDSPHRHTTTVGGGVSCVCKEGHTTPGLRWYPSVSRGRESFDGASINDPGSQINDKLAPLN